MDSVNESNDLTTEEQDELSGSLMNIPDIHLAEAPGLPENGEVGIRVPVNVIMDQMHQHYAQIIAGQVQRNAELAAALTTTSDELVELRSKFAALQSVTNAPDDGAAPAVRTIPHTDAGTLPDEYGNPRH